MKRDEAVKRCGERALCSGRVAERDEQTGVHVDPVGRGLPGGETAAVEVGKERSVRKERK